MARLGCVYTGRYGEPCEPGFGMSPECGFGRSGRCALSEYGKYYRSGDLALMKATGVDPSLYVSPRDYVVVDEIGTLSGVEANTCDLGAINDRPNDVKLKCMRIQRKGKEYLVVEKTAKSEDAAITLFMEWMRLAQIEQFLAATDSKQVDIAMRHFVRPFGYNGPTGSFLFQYPGQQSLLDAVQNSKSDTYRDTLILQAILTLAFLNGNVYFVHGMATAERGFRCTKMGYKRTTIYEVGKRKFIIESDIQVKACNMGLATLRDEVHAGKNPPCDLFAEGGYRCTGVWVPASDLVQLNHSLPDSAKFLDQSKVGDMWTAVSKDNDKHNFCKTNLDNAFQFLTTSTRFDKFLFQSTPPHTAVVLKVNETADDINALAVCP
jgi:hypothetical protein